MVEKCVHFESGIIFHSLYDRGPGIASKWKNPPDQKKINSKHQNVCTHFSIIKMKGENA